MIYLDFDGVLFDTAFEAYVISCVARDASELLNSETNYTRFLLARSYITAAWNYNIVVSALLSSLQDRELIDFVRNGANRLPTEEDLLFEKKFIATRRRYAAENRIEWLGLSRPFDFWVNTKDLITKLPEYFTILSTKDKQSIQDVLVHNGAPAQLRILGKEVFEEHNRSKASVIKSDKNRSGRALFVDDSFEHLHPVSQLEGLEVYWARWGYVPIEDKQENHLEATELIKRILGII